MIHRRSFFGILAVAAAAPIAVPSLLDVAATKTVVRRSLPTGTMRAQMLEKMVNPPVLECHSILPGKIMFRKVPIRLVPQI